MCYFLHGAVYGDIDQAEYYRFTAGHKYHFNIGTKHDVKNDVNKSSYDFCVTNNMCGCDSPVGSKDASSPELKEYEALFFDLKKVPGLKQIYLCKTWTGKRNKKEVTVKIEDIDVPSFLANVEESCLYTFEME